jgi:hypothetical protein
MAFHGVLLTSSMNLNVGSMYWFSRCQVYIPSIIHLHACIFTRTSFTRVGPRTKGKGGLERSRRPPAASSNNSSHLEFFHSRGGKGGSKPRRPRRPPAPAGPPFGDSTSQQRWAAAPTAAARRRVEVAAARATCACVHTFSFSLFFRGWWRGGAEAAAQVNVSDCLERRRVGMEPNNNKNNIWAAASTW